MTNIEAMNKLKNIVEFMRQHLRWLGMLDKDLEGLNNIIEKKAKEAKISKEEVIYLAKKLPVFYLDKLTKEKKYTEKH